MGKCIFIITVIVFCFNCKSKKSEALPQQQADEHIIIENQVFLSENINDTLLSFITSIDDTPNSFGAPTMYIVDCSKNRKDTFLTFCASPVLMEGIYMQTGNKDTLFRLVGGRSVNNKPVIIYSYAFESMDWILYEDSLSIDFVNENDFFSKHKIEDDGWHYTPHPEWRYKLVNNDSLVLISKQKGKHEK
ncbi:MAG: hypothetical protein LBK94_07475 [Prevotellaceae bacterium]|jgi:hypothetical protein|nr:hypothetical protein [Prevotellaceae bacterium]